ncbi:MAG: hypothetical protein H6714_00610 [Myxococcales bacterium]|nr:hypothetical protein [Myxococcales bacterium]
MDAPLFDPGGFYEFDLSHGQVRTSSGERMLVLSSVAAGPLISAAVSGGDLTSMRQFGRQLAGQAMESLGMDAEGLAAETVLGHASSVLALCGWGRLRLERWGDMVLAVLDDLPALDRDNLAAAALLGGLLSSLSGLDVACVPLSEAGQFVVVDPSIAETIWSWSRAGDSAPQVAGKLGGRA